MTRDGYIEMIEDRLVRNHVGVDTSEMFSQQMIGSYLDVCYSTVLNQIIEKEKRSSGRSELDTYAKSFYGLEVKEDLVRNEKYVLLPYKPASLTGNKSLRSVSANADKLYSFFIRNNGPKNIILSQLDVNNLEDGVCYLDGDRVYFEKIDPDLSKISVVFIPGLLALDEDIDVVLPREGEANVVDMCYNMLVSKYNLPPDNVNDQTSV